MRLRQIVVAAAVLGALCVPAHAEARDISRDTLPADNGWAAYGTGTTGGSAADDAHVFTVTDRAGLARALGGNSDSATGDRGKLRVTLHHNQFESVVQRAPRVRFGQVHVYDNRYVVPEGSEYRYSLGVSTESGIYAENNSFHTPGHVEVADLVKSWNGTALHQTGTLWGSPRTESGGGSPVDLLAIYNAYNSGSERDLTADVGWTPTLHTKIDSAEAADREVAHGAGAGRIP